ncbi:MAG: chemotaxis protein CheW [Burkholderiaceae bacterium]
METAEKPRVRENRAQGEGPSKEFLTFKLAGEEYGIDILKVQEIRGYEKPTRIANAPHFILGVINLRGVIVPIVDLRIKFGMGDAQYTSLTVVIILNVGKRVVGVVVDSVSDVLQLIPSEIREAPEMASAVDSNYLIGLGTIDDRMLILIDIEKLISAPEMTIVEL